MVPTMRIINELLIWSLCCPRVRTMADLCLADICFADLCLAMSGPMVSSGRLAMFVADGTFRRRVGKQWVIH